MADLLTFCPPGPCARMARISISRMGMESVSLNFSEYKMEFWPQSDTATQEAAIEAEYNIRTQT